LVVNVGIIGKYCSGKDTVADYLVYKYGYCKKSLAAPIVWIMNEFYGIKSKTDFRYRRFAQLIGTDWFRSLDNNVWINYLIKDVKKNPRIPVVVSDVRFVNEVERMLELNDLGKMKWELIYLDCPDEVRIERAKKRDGCFDETTLKHESEVGVDMIYNTYKDKLYIMDSSKEVANSYEDIDKFAQNKLTQISCQLPFYEENGEIDFE